MKIFCLYFGDRYSPDYVGKLYRGLKRNYDGDFEFICYTDNMSVEADRLIRIPENTDIKKHWHKLKFFDSTFGEQSPNEEIVILDIDQVVVGDMTPVLGCPVDANQLATYEKWDADIPTIQINGGFYKFLSGTKDYVYQKFISDPSYWQLYYFNKKIVTIPYYGEQNFVQDTVRENGDELVLVPGKHLGFYMGNTEHEYYKQYNQFWNLTYRKKFDCLYMYMGNAWHKNVRIVHFAHLLNQIHDCEESWLNQHWI